MWLSRRGLHSARKIACSARFRGFRWTNTWFCLWRDQVFVRFVELFKRYNLYPWTDFTQNTSKTSLRVKNYQLGVTVILFNIYTFIFQKTAILGPILTRHLRLKSALTLSSSSEPHHNFIVNSQCEIKKMITCVFRTIYAQAAWFCGRAVNFLTFTMG